LIRLGTIVTTLVLAIGLALVGCAPSEGPAPEDESPPTAPEGEAIEWVAQGASPAGTLVHEIYEMWADDIGLASNGRLTVTLHPGGAVAPAGKEMDALDTGTIDAGITNPHNSLDKVPSGAILNTMVGGMSHSALEVWFDQAGGAELMDRAFGQFNVNIISHRIIPPEVWGHSTKEINSLADMNGLKFRTAGDAGEIFAEMGVSVVHLAGGEIYEALQRGVVDCAEYNLLATNWTMGFHEVAKYVYMSSTRAPSACNMIVVNKDKWEELPADLKALVLDVSRANRDYRNTRDAYENMMAIEMYEDFGNELVHLPADVEAETLRLAEEFYKTKSAELGGLYKEIVDSQMAFRAVYEPFEALDRPLV